MAATSAKYVISPYVFCPSLQLVSLRRLYVVYSFLLYYGIITALSFMSGPLLLVTQNCCILGCFKTA